MLTINRERFLDDLADLAKIGATADGGVTRLALSPEDVAGRQWFAARVREAGLTFRQDGAGNLSAVLPSTNPNAPTLLAGSHLDTVPNGGRFDGSLGVMCAFEAVRTIKEAGLTLPVHLEAISFTDEEGSFLGIMGSQAVTGQLTQDKLAHARGGQAALAEGMARLGITADSMLSAQRDPASLRGFVEVHIEQGTRLEEGKIDIGVVTGIVGIRSAWLTFTGQAAHAGTMPMTKRADAFWGAASFVQRAKKLVMARYTPGVMNCGIVELAPGAFNIVPATAKLALEFRHGTEELLDEMADVLFELAQEVAAANGLGLDIKLVDGCVAAPASEVVMGAIEKSAVLLGLSSQRMMSFAGHDTQAMSTITPSGMIFVPSVDGISHNPKEFTHADDLVNGANVMLQTLLLLAEM